MPEMQGMLYWLALVLVTSQTDQLMVAGASGQSLDMTDVIALVQVNSPVVDTTTVPPSDGVPRHPMYQDSARGWLVVIMNLYGLLWEYYDRTFVASACKRWSDFSKALEEPWGRGNTGIIFSHLSQILFYWILGIWYYMDQDGFSFATSVHVLGQQLSTVGFGDSGEVPHTEALRSRMFGMIQALQSKLVPQEAIVRPMQLMGPLALWFSMIIGYVLLMVDRLDELSAKPGTTVVQVTYLFVMAITSIGLGDITPKHEWAKVVLGLLYPSMCSAYDTLITYMNQGPQRIHYPTLTAQFESKCPEEEFPEERTRWFGWERRSLKKDKQAVQLPSTIDTQERLPPTIDTPDAKIRRSKTMEDVRLPSTFDTPDVQIRRSNTF